MITKQARQRAANMMAARQGLSTTQAGVDAMWRGIAARLNATLPSSTTPSPRPARALQGQADAMWGSIVAGLNASDGLMDRAR